MYENANWIQVIKDTTQWLDIRAIVNLLALQKRKYLHSPAEKLSVFCLGPYSKEYVTFKLYQC